MMTLKPFRDYDEHNVVNLFALNASSGDEGSLVYITGSGFINGQEHEVINIYSANQALSQRYALKSKLAYATSGMGKRQVLGVMIKNVRSTDYLGRDLAYDEVRLAEANAVYSGCAVEVLRKGMLLVKGYSGAAAPGSGAVADNAVAGDWLVVDGANTNSIGKFIGSADADGYAPFILDC